MKLRKLVLSLFTALLFSMSLAFAQTDINTADQQELEMINGIGPSTAEAIIHYRKQHGAFSSMDELLNVKGIGDKKLSKLAQYITISTPKE